MGVHGNRCRGLAAITAFTHYTALPDIELQGKHVLQTFPTITAVAILPIQ